MGFNEEAALKIFQNSQVDTCVGISFSIKMQVFSPATSFKKTPTQKFLVNITKNTCFKNFL